MLSLKDLKRFNQILNGAVFVVGMLITLAGAQFLELHYLPVKDLKLIDNYEVRGTDLWVSGSFRKLRNCEYIKPVRAVDETGLNLYVVAHSPTSGQSWQPDSKAQKFGPWQIVLGAGHRVRIYQEYACHDLWNQFDNIGTVDATGEIIKVEMAP